MFECPACNQTLSSIVHNKKIFHSSILTKFLSGIREKTLSHEETEEKWICPKCGAELAESEEEAEKLINQKDNL